MLPKWWKRQWIWQLAKWWHQKWLASGSCSHHPDRRFYTLYIYYYSLSFTTWLELSERGKQRKSVRVVNVWKINPEKNLIVQVRGSTVFIIWAWAFTVSLTLEWNTVQRFYSLSLPITRCECFPSNVMFQVIFWYYNSVVVTECEWSASCDAPDECDGCVHPCGVWCQEYDEQKQGYRRQSIFVSVIITTCKIS